jgi:myo-inositol-1(or 4)-monophosphatase
VESEIEKRVLAGREAVEKRKALVHEKLGRVESEWKPDASRVTEVDFAVAREVFAELSEAFPDDDYFSEEMDPGQGALELRSEFSWVLDPIDGTNNFAAGLSSCAISLALLREGQPVYGLLYDVSRSRLIEGGPGIRLWDGGRPTSMRPAPSRTGSTVGVNTPRNRAFASLMGEVASRYKIRALGSGALSMGYVGAGMLDGAVDVNVKVWDIAAAHAICLAGGAEVRYLNGEVFPLRKFDLDMPTIFYCAGSGPVCDELEKMVAKTVQSAQ